MNKHQYSTDHLTMVQKKDIVNLFLKNADSRNHIDILDCHVSFARQRTSLDPKTIFKFLTKNSHFSIFEREDSFFQNSPSRYVELGIRTNYKNNSELFLFSFMSPEQFEKSVKNKYKLK